MLVCVLISASSEIICAKLCQTTSGVDIITFRMFATSRRQLFKQQKSSKCMQTLTEACDIWVENSEKKPVG